MAKHRNNKFKDSDADGLPDELEKKLGTDPKKADSDNDGLCDYEETKIYCTDPLDPDTDKDGMKDGDEVRRGRNPRGRGMLKNLFIPHEGNNFKPHALHPYRLLFYAVSSVILKVILVGAVIVLPIEAWLTPDILAEQSKKIVNLTNEIRKNLGVALLAESALLNQAAYNKAQDMLLSQYFSHTGPDGKTLSAWLKEVKYGYSIAGENLAVGFSSPEGVVNGWTRSQTHYQNMIDPDFKEIGVGMTSGLYNNVDTTLVAQYFAAPTAKVQFAVTEPVIKKETVAIESQTVEPSEKVDTIPEPQALGEKIEPVIEQKIEEKVVPEIQVQKPEVVDMIKLPEIDQEKSKLYVDEPDGKNNLVVRAEVYLTADVKKAWVNFNNYFIDLSPAEGGEGKWVGQTIIFKEDQEQIFNPVVLASITAEDGSGNTITQDLKWDNIKPAATTKLEQYYFIKQHQSPYIQPLFDITSIYYKILFVIASIALALNVLIQVKKQHPHIILSTLGLISLLAVLIIT